MECEADGMKLTDLNPKWVGCGEPGNEIIFGLRFDCPHCRVQKLAVLFSPFIDPHNWIPRIGEFHMDKQKWNREGETFETLTLKPSINTEFSGHWHGFIENGEVK